jgi:CysZ protein
VIVISQFLRGAGCLFDGYALVFRPRLRRFVYVPLLVNSLLFALGIIASFRVLSAWVSPWLEKLPDWLDWLQWLLLPLFGAFVVGVLFFAFALVANLISAPFNGLLAERCEQQLRGETPSSLRPWYKEIPGALLGELVKLRYYLTRALPLLLLSLIPAVGLLASAVLLIFTVWMLGLEYLDYPLGNRGLLFPQQRMLASRNRWSVLGFGSAVFLLTLVPVVNFTVMPAAVAGATRLVCGERSGFS